jgi:hypothetical protein
MHAKSKCLDNFSKPKMSQFTNVFNVIVIVFKLDPLSST